MDHDIGDSETRNRITEEEFVEDSSLSRYLDDSDVRTEEEDRDVLDAFYGETNMLQWLQALDMQVVGGCRTDERLKPLLKLNIDNGTAEEKLLTHISQHFDASEVGMLARCLCVPLVSIRVGKVSKEGSRLCPTTIRGHLNLSLLPSSDLRISFTRDDGHIERLVLLNSAGENLTVAIDAIPADRTGRSFLVKLPNGKVSFFWCSEKSKELGDELIAKMKDLVTRRPSLSQLTGISNSRLDFFAIHLRAYFLSSTVSTESNTIASSISVTPVSVPSKLDSVSEQLPTLSFVSQLRDQQCKSHTIHESSMITSSDLFEGSTPQTSTVRSTEVLWNENNCLHMCPIDIPPILSFTMKSSCPDSTKNLDCNQDTAMSNRESQTFEFLETCGPSSSFPSFIPPSSHIPYLPELSTNSPLFYPYHCWCPPFTSSLPLTPSYLQPSIPSGSFSLPPLSSLLPSTRTSSISASSKSHLDIPDLPSTSFPAFFPEPICRFPLSSQQIPTFIPFVADPIVHIPVINVCSSGQGYFVSAGSAISTSIPPHLPNLVHTLMPETDSTVEKGARETLRLLIGSAQMNTPLMGILPAVLGGSSESFSYTHSTSSIPSVSGSRGLYAAPKDFDAITNKSMCPVGLTASQPSTNQSEILGSDTCFSAKDVMEDLIKDCDPSQDETFEESSECVD